MAKKLYVGNLPFTCADAELAQVFEQFGQVISARVITDRETGRSKGFGFVEMSTQEETDKAIEKLNAKVIDGKKIRVKWSNQEKKQAEAIASAPAPKRDIPEDVWGSASRNSSERENDDE